jgi:hypothetical protein
MSDPGLTSQPSPWLRPVAIAVVCVLAVGAALWLSFAPRHEATTPPVQPAPQPQAEVAPPPRQAAPAAPATAAIALPPVAAVVAQPTPAPPAAVAVAPPPPAAPVQPPAIASAAPPAATPAPPPAAKPAEESGQSTRPSFDIVRVNPQGDAVIAGRAAPGTEVTVADNGHAIGKTEADAQGQWVIVPAAPIGPGGRELTVASQAPDQQPVKGDAPVLVLMPDKPKPTRAPTVVASAPPTAPSPAPAAPVVVLTPSDAAPRLLQPPPAAQPPSARSGLGLGTVDYDDRGDIRFAGTAPPGATVRTYVDNQPAGDAAADAQGHWTLMPQAGVAVGDHRLRLDQLGGNGHVTARLELPFQRAELSPQEVAEGRIVVQPGQNLWRIARHAYGRGIQYVVIYQANRTQIRDPNLIYPGQAFAIPAPPAPERGSAAMPASSSTSR